MDEFIAILRLDSKVIEHHFFLVPEFLEVGFYRATVSFSAFQTREARRLHKAHQRGVQLAGYRASIRSAEEWREDMSFWKEERGKARMSVSPPEVPTFHHDSVWKMYEAIGYSYKLKRYIR
jgi:hypothetical protein